jgi:tetratricopeptide (TPR) repeat protein
MIGWFDSREAAEVGKALAEKFALKAAAPGPNRAGSNKASALQELLQRADSEARPLRLNFYKKAKLANSFKWQLIEKGVDPSVADNVTQSLILHLSSPSIPVSHGDAAPSPSSKADHVSARQLLTQAQGRLSHGAYAEAADLFEELIAIAPQTLDAHLGYGATLCRLGRYAEAEQCFRRVIEINPDCPEAHFNLGNVLRWCGEMAEAETSLRTALKLRPGYIDARASLGLVLAFFGRLREARRQFEKVLKAAPRDAEALVGMGQIARLEGRFDEAERRCNLALKIEPGLSSALSTLVTLRKMTRADSDWLAHARQGLASSITPLEEADIRFALGKYHDDLNEYAQAFENFQRANDLLKSVAVKYDREARSFHVSDQIRVYTREVLSKVGEGGSPSKKPIFVVGMMRSGTSLAEQIIASHPSADGVGELSFWSEAVRSHESEVRSGMPNEATKKRLAEEYLRILTEHASDASQRIVDKAPFNCDHLGVIHSVFPNARIIYMRRNPIDICLSCYFQPFPASMNFTLDLSDLAHYYREHQRLIDHWRAVLPADRFMEIPYEGLVSDFQDWTQRIMDFLELPWDDKLLDFHKTQRNVITASAWQVRQKIYKNSVDRWRNYEKFLGPLKSLKSL